jgi:hypothetical protein
MVQSHTDNRVRWGSLGGQAERATRDRRRPFEPDLGNAGVGKTSRHLRNRQLRPRRFLVCPGSALRDAGR